LSFADSPLLIPVARWHLCEPGVAPPDVGFVEPLLRRRLSGLAKMTLCAANACAAGAPGASLVFASRHGELARTTAALESLADGEPLSPALFSLSVLNASLGVFSILQGNTAPATAISAGGASFGYGLLDACLRLADEPGRPVLYVYADEPAPGVYGEVDGPEAEAHALGLLLSAEAGQRVACSVDESSEPASAETQSRAFVRCLEDGRAEWRGLGKRWRWERSA